MTKIYRIRLSLDDAEPEIWRRIEVPGDLSLASLHWIIQKLFGWDDYHLWEFKRDGQHYGMPEDSGWGPPTLDAWEHSIADVLGPRNKKLNYMYDFGDSWRVTLRVEKRLEPDPDADYPRCTGGERSGPPEDCGGIWGYQDIIEGLEEGDLDPDLRGWLGDWKPDDFDPEEVTLPPGQVLEGQADMAGGPAQPSMGGFSALGMSEEDLRAQFLATFGGGPVGRTGGDETSVPMPDRQNLGTYPVSNSLADCLSRLPVEYLDAIFENFDFDERPSRRGDREKAIAARLQEPGVVEGLLEEVEDDGLALLEFLSQFHREEPMVDVIGNGLLPARADQLGFESDSALGQLRRRGLVHVGLGRVDGEEYVYVGVPVELRERIEAWIGENWSLGAQQGAEIAEDLLWTPPVDERELEQRLNGIPREKVRENLVARIAAGELVEDGIPAAGHLFAILGAGEQRGRLEEILTDPTPDSSEERRRSRLAAYAVLSHMDVLDPESAARELGISLERAQHLAEEVFAIILRISQDVPMLARMPGQQLLGVEPEMREAVFAEIERVRRESGAQAGLVYRPLLEDETYREIWPLLIDAIVEAGSPGDAGMLERRARALEEPEQSKRFRRAAMELRSRGIEEQVELAGYGLVGSCDGAGAYPVFVCLEESDDSFSVMNLLLRARDLALRDGFFLPEMPASELDELIEHIEMNGVSQFVRVPSETAVSELHRALRFGEQRGEKVPEDLHAVVHRLDRMPDPGEDYPEVEAASRVSREEVAQLLEDPMFQSWVFDLSELHEADLLPLPDRYELEPYMIEGAAEALAEIPRVRERLASMCEHMVRWFHYAGDTAEAEVFAAVSDRVREDFAGAALVREMVAKTVEFYELRPDLGELAPLRQMGAPDLRLELRGRLRTADAEIQEVDPEFRLDVIELCFQVLEFLRPYVRDDEQPRYEEVFAAAGEVGDDIVGAFVGDRDVRDTVEESFADLEWLDGVRDLAVSEAVDNINALVEYVR